MSVAFAQPQLDAIAAACQQHQVRRMHLFGLEQQLIAITG